MRPLLIAAAATLSLAGAALAATDATAGLQAAVDGYVRGVDLGTLSDAQVNAIKTAVYSGDSPAEIRAFIRSVVNG
ncbi:MAG: hypothetical protein N2Z62_12940 [Rhodobacteraceae bacterium]|nr:hypothetical protein [Paracoccaceae bacterium]